MNHVIGSFFSLRNSSTGIMVYNLEMSKPVYMQLLDLKNLPLRMFHARGISHIGDRLYVVVPCALLIFRINIRKDGPLFVLEKTVCRPEWVMGGRAQGDLHAVHASASHKRLYVSFNAQGAIDVMDLDGEFLERKYLWEMSPDVFPMPNKISKNDFQFGDVRHIYESSDGRILLTVALLNGTQEGAVIDFDDGTIVIGPTSLPLHSGFCSADRVYLCNIRNAEIQAFNWPPRFSKPLTLPVQSYNVTPFDQREPSNGMAVRGLTKIGERLLCGVFFLGKSKKQRASWMAEFDLNTGAQAQSHLLPSLEGAVNPTIHSLIPVTREIESAVGSWEKPKHYRGDKMFNPVSSVYSNEDGDKTNVQTMFHDGLSDYNEVSLKKNSSPVITASNVGINFIWIGSMFKKITGRTRSDKSFWALRNVSFEVNEGEMLGVIGRNGSGKSTLAMACTGVYQPDEGEIKVNGRVQLLALGLGFKGELSGRENVMISGSLMGLSKQAINSKMDEIEEFSELGRFMDEPVRTYSSGMRSRLGFAVATAVQPDILILDEVMSTGDQAFRDKAMARMKAMRSQARSVIIVSHHRSQLKKLCNKVLWLEKGRVMMIGRPKPVLNSYDQFCKNPEKWLSRHKPYLEALN